jgi:hypothetical protein
MNKNFLPRADKTGKYQNQTGNEQLHGPKVLLYCRYL